MAQKTSGEFEKEFMDRLRASTGSDLAAWMKAIDGFNSKKRNEVIAWLKSEHGFGHMNASRISASGVEMTNDTSNTIPSRLRR